MNHGCNDPRTSFSPSAEHLTHLRLRPPTSAPLNDYLCLAARPAYNTARPRFRASRAAPVRPADRDGRRTGAGARLCLSPPHPSSHWPRGRSSTSAPPRHAKSSRVTQGVRAARRAICNSVSTACARHLQRVLLGRGASEKRTPAIDPCLIRCWSELLDEGCPDYRATLIRKIETLFEVRLSGEAIRQINCRGCCESLGNHR